MFKLDKKDKDGKKIHSDIVAIDLGNSSTKVVRLKKVKGQLTLAGVGLEKFAVRRK